MKEATGEEFGVYVKRILPGGLASTDGTLLLVVIRLLSSVVFRIKSGESQMSDLSPESVHSNPRSAAGLKEVVVRKVNSSR